MKDKDITTLATIQGQMREALLLLDRTTHILFQFAEEILSKRIDFYDDTGKEFLVTAQELSMKADEIEKLRIITTNASNARSAVLANAKDFFLELEKKMFFVIRGAPSAEIGIGEEDSLLAYFKEVALKIKEISLQAGAEASTINAPLLKEICEKRLPLAKVLHEKLVSDGMAHYKQFEAECDALLKDQSASDLQSQEVTDILAKWTRQFNRMLRNIDVIIG